MNPTIVMELPYAEMSLDSIDPSGWMASMDVVFDADREVCIVICAAKEPEMEKAVSKSGEVRYRPKLGLPEIDWGRP